ncbi:MAG: hypothetical protein KIS78_01230 [Labilithrix sp.]|nr:hypothetical protein [Labilithrix sp.]MCW5831062.1 hypothetical protein [Labilithrix sp.]
MAAVLLVLEVVTRTKLFAMSKDFRHFMGFAEAATALDHGVAFVGNSATRLGVDPAIVARELGDAKGEAVTADVFTADASRINTWHYILESTFWRPGKRPRLVVLTFYEDDLADGNRIEIGRVAQFFTTTRDWPDVFRVDLPTFGERTEFVVSSAWATYAARARIRERTLRLIPGYEPYAAAQNDVVFKHERAREAAARPELTHVALHRLLRRAAEEETRLCFVAYPTLEAAQGEPYPIDTAGRAAVEAAGMRFIDLRRVDGLGPELYDDDVHLNEAGRALYSAVLADALREAL